MKAIKRTLILTAAGLLAALSLTACGGGGSGGSTAGATTVSKGVVEKFGSVKVNGVEFKTVGAVLHLPDDAATPNRVLQNELEIRDHLQVGMVVTVRGRVDDNGISGTATELEFRDVLEGRIDSKVGDTLTVMGQTILVDDSIKSGLNSLAVGDDVQVSGIIDDKGGLRATHIAKKTGLTEFEGKGFVSGFTGAADNDFILLLSPTAVSGITVNIGAGVVRPAGLVNGAFVEVKTATTAGGVITASKIEIEDELEAAENEKAEFEGFISSIAGNSFVLNGQTVQTSATTIFVGGVSADLAVGMKVEAEGNISAGVLNASKISFKDNLRIDANAIAVDTAASTITILGKTVTYNSGTDFRDGGSTIADPATLLNKHIEVRGLMNAAGTGIVATRVTLKSATPANDAFIRGVVSAKTASSLTIAGINISLAGSTFKDKNDAVIADMASFLAAVNINTTAVKARWNPFNLVTDAVKEAELEN